MAVTRLKRKARRNRTRARVRQEDIQRLGAKPIIKSVDVEAIKEEFKSTPKKAAKKEPKAEAPVKEEKAAAKKAETKKAEATPKAEAESAEPAKDGE